MNSLEKIVNGILKKRLQKKKEKEERAKIEQEKQERNEKIYKAISDFVKKGDIRQYVSGNEYEFVIGETKIVVKVTDCGDFRFDYQAVVTVNSMKLDASKWLKRQLAAEIRESTVKKDEEDKERIIEEAAATVGKNS